MKRELYDLHSILPPAELMVKLDREVRVHNNLQAGRCKLALKWKNEDRFTICLMEYEEGSGPYRSTEIGHRSVSMGAGYGAGRSVSYSPVFCGRIAPDEGGSVISGHFRQPLWAWLVCVAGVYGVGLVSCAITGQYLIYLAAVALGIPMFRSLLVPQRTQSSGELWDALEFLVATVDGLAMGQGASEENDQAKE